jgi:mannose/fructose-specific phosphotransferase system component IIA
MNSKYLTFIVAHEDVARALLNAVQKIVGQQEEVYCFTNKKDSLPIIALEMEQKIKQSEYDVLVCFTDLKGGSCWTVANMVKKKFPGLIVISGANLPMLITYFNNMSNMETTALINKTVSDACRGIQKQSD